MVLSPNSLLNYSKRWGDLLSFLAGAILLLAFAPLHLYLFALLSPAILLGCWMSASPSRALWRGWLFGMGMFGVGVSWVYVSIHEFGNTAAPLAAILTLLFVSCLAFFPALQGYIFRKISSRNRLLDSLLLFPVTWVLFEWIRSWFLTGFPWLLLGFSQVSSPLRGFIPLIGAYGVAFLILISSGSIYIVLTNIKSNVRRLFTVIPLVIILAGIWGGGAYLSDIQWTQPLGKPLRVAMIQGNIQQDQKWLANQIRPTLRTYYDLTTQHWNSDIIIWPEAAIPIPLKFAKSFLKGLDLQAKKHHVTLITGIPVEVPNRFSFYNAMITLGNGRGHYYKRRLVPFGEFVPFGNLLRGVIALLDIPMSDMKSGPEDQPDLSAGRVKIAPFICYETAYWQDLYRELPAGNVLVTISNDAWFGNSLAPYQHLEMGQFRAMQGGRAMLFSSNNGITAIINAQGEVVKRIPQFVRAVLTGEVQPRSGSTPWIRYGGNTPIILFFWALFLLLFLKRMISYDKNNSKNPVL